MTLRPILFPGLAALALLPVAAAAEVPRVVADIAPVHSLVAQAMAGLGEPALLLRPGASPHDHAMRPSEAAALADADLVVWVGPQLTPWLAGPVANLVDGATLALLAVDGTIRHPYREVHGGHDDGHDHAHDHDHGGGSVDPHAWLDPANGTTWLAAIAEALAALDPENAATYRANAAEGAAAIDAAAAEANALLAPNRATPFVVYHDAYQYFETRFGLPPGLPIAPGDATPPGPAHVERVAREVADEGIACVFAEPQFGEGLVTTVIGDHDVRVAILDPLGGAVEPGPTLYPQLIRNLATAIADCATAK